MVNIFHYLPEVYQSFFPDFFKSEIPEEILSTCQDCAMCDKGQGLLTNRDLFFSQDTKCCTYFPIIPNYLVGGILSDLDEHCVLGRDRLIEIIKNGVGVTPFGIYPPKKYKLLYETSKGKAFGKALTLKCPFYNRSSGGCLVWKFRSSVCSTWFCKHVKGIDGEAFWNATKKYISIVELNISNYILSHLNFHGKYIVSSKDNDALTLEDVEGNVDTSSYQKRWRHWTGQHVDFYIQSFQIVSRITPEFFKEIMGLNGLLHIENLESLRKDMLFPKIASYLMRNPALDVYKTDKGYLLVNDIGNFEVSKKIYELLDLFDGSLSTDEINSYIQKEHSCTIGKNLLVKLFQNKVLIPIA